jgi:predicted DCC family thiol-disulfide oxidoreductase YuxK
VPANKYPVILFDGHCRFCCGVVRQILRLDRKGRFRFATLQSDVGQRLRQENSIPENIKSIVLIEDKTSYVRSDAVLAIIRHLPFGIIIAGPARLVSRQARDRLYAWFARNRYKWFGQAEKCFIPDDQTKDRFLS